MRKRVLYVSLQRTIEGQASYAHVHGIVDGLRGLGWEVTLLQPTYSNDSLGSLGRFVYAIWTQLRCLRTLREVDLLYCRMHVLLLPLAVVARACGRPVVQEVNGPAEDARAAYPWLALIWRVVSWLYEVTVRHASGVIAVTAELEAACVRSGARRVITVPNGADTGLFRPHASPNVTERYVLFFGAFSRWQGIEVALAAASAPDWPAGVGLWFAGDGVLRPTIVEVSQSNPLVRWIGIVPHREMPGTIAGAIACVVPKTLLVGHDRSGLSPLKLYEAVAVGTRVIVSDILGLAEFVRDGLVGWVVPPGNADALAQAVATAAATRWTEADKLRAHNFVAASHSWAARARATASFLEHVYRQELGRD